MTRIRQIFFFAVQFACVSVFAQEAAAAKEANSVTTLLAGYLSNDLSLQKAMVTAQGAGLSVDTAKINNGIAVSLSSGTITVYSNAKGTNVELRPSATVSIPQARDTTISASMPVTFQNGGTSTNTTSTVSSDEVSIKNASVSVSTGILTGTPQTKKIAILEAERKLLEAERDVQDKAITAEKDFYTALKKLYNYAVTVLSRRADLYDDELELKKLQAQGYNTTSSTYRRADLKVRSDRRNVRDAERTLDRETAVFAKKCGMTYEKSNEDQFEHAIAFLPAAIPEVTPVNPLSFAPEAYTERENAAWNTYIAELKRKAEKDVTLRANLGYTFNNSYSDSDTVDAGLSLNWNGLTATAGVSLATGNTLFNSSAASSGSGDPVYTFSVGWVPNTWRLAKITEQQHELNKQLEEIALQTAANNYDTSMADKISSISDTLWSQKSYQEEYDLYLQLEQDTENLYKRGIATENDWRDARDNRQKAEINVLINAIDIILFNDETRLLFHDDAGTN